MNSASSAFAIQRLMVEAEQEFDLIIIGGGITGISVAREAASRGLKTVLLERGDFGSGTSAATTKYIHGGIRYLEQYDVAVVRESLRERRILALGAPHLVEQTRFIMPAWRWSKPPTALIGAGVLLYDTLAFDRNLRAPDSLRIPHPRWLSRSKLLAAVPWLDQSGLQGGFAYHDTLNVHPERLLLAYAKSATAAGAVLLNHTRVNSFVSISSERLHIEGVRATDVLSGQEMVIRGKVVVNAAGPWIDKVLATLGKGTGVGVDRSKGVHVLTRPLGGPGRVTDAVFARAQSGRHVIVSPWMGKSFIGPTDTPIESDETGVVVDPDDVTLILDTVNSTMAESEPKLTTDDVEMTTVGVRPLIRETANDDDTQDTGTYSASRAHELYHHADHGVDNLWSIGGGKWTTGRATAEEMVDELLKNELKMVRSRTFDSRSSAAGGAFAWAEDAEPFITDAAMAMNEHGIPVHLGEHIARLYGTEWVRIDAIVQQNPDFARQLSPQCNDIEAQIVFAVTEEGARTLSDIVDRRLVIGTIGSVSREVLERVALIAGPLLGWDELAIQDAIRHEFDRRTVIATHWRTPVGGSSQ
jgi:glycerol-3-phosphate dehydrogenase